ncbi:hypothetical protein V8G54_010997 [Vigna mungo]|uniref:Uncharacterized protein n=1 Tax=Vigna mungo TaxID=3915 RepID=A0AAQ3NR39_VIGMU
MRSCVVDASKPDQLSRRTSHSIQGITGDTNHHLDHCWLRRLAPPLLISARDREESLLLYDESPPPQTNPAATDASTVRPYSHRCRYNSQPPSPAHVTPFSPFFYCGRRCQRG